MRIIVPATPFVPRRRKRRPARPAPAAPVLVSATYATGTSVTLTFDRAVDVTGFNGYAIGVDDANLAIRYDGSLGATLLGPATVEVGLMDVASAEGSGVRLSAGPAAGIVAAEGGAAWAGVADLALPWP